MMKTKIKLSVLALTVMVSSSCLAPSVSVIASESNQSVISSNQQIIANNDSTDMNSISNDLMRKAINLETQIEKEILSKGYSSVEEYNNQIGDTIPVEESIYYNNAEYYNTPLSTTLIEDENRAIPLVIWAKVAFSNPWVRKAITMFGKAIITGAGAALGATVVNDTREIIRNGYPKISTHSSSDVVGYGRVTNGNKVKVAQLLLREQGFNIAVDGIWGPASESATKSFQRRLNMSADGLIGKHTWAYLIEHLK